MELPEDSHLLTCCGSGTPGHSHQMPPWPVCSVPRDAQRLVPAARLRAHKPLQSEFKKNQPRPHLWVFKPAKAAFLHSPLPAIWSFCAPLACALCGCARTCPCAARALHFPIVSWRRESSYLWSAELRESHSRVVRSKAISNAAKTCIINSSVSKSLRDWVTVFFFAPSDYAAGWVTAVMIEELESLCLSSFVWPKIHFTGHLCSISSKSL